MERPPGVGVRPSSRGKQEEKEWGRSGFFGLLIFFSFFMRNNPRNQPGDENEKGAPAL